MPTLTLKQQPNVPLEAENICPDRLAGLSVEAVRALPIFLGKRTVRLDEFFDITPESDDVVVHGDLLRVKWLGKGMTTGRLAIHGRVGMHLGAFMRGGTIEVHGQAGDWVGGEMAGGLIHVHGNAGGQIGAAYRGSVSGMSGGTILIDGNAGIEVGMRMRRGLIGIGGKAKDFAGLQMKGGTIVLAQGAELRTGAWMQRGTIVSFAPLKLMPTFGYCCDYQPSFWPMYVQKLNSLGFPLPDLTNDAVWRRFAGDRSVPGKGEILVPPASP